MSSIMALQKPIVAIMWEIQKIIISKDMVFNEQFMGLNWLHIIESKDYMNNTIPQGIT
jgi:hypothetical protein